MSESTSQDLSRREKWRPLLKRATLRGMPAGMGTRSKSEAQHEGTI